MKLAIALGFTVLPATVAAQPAAPSQGGSGSWDPAAAAAYLDSRMDLWFVTGAKLRTGDAETVCISCTRD